MELHTTVSVDEEKSVARIALAGALNTDTAPGFDTELQQVVARGLDLTVLDMKSRSSVNPRCVASSSSPVRRE